MPNFIRQFLLLSLVLILTGCACCSNTTITSITENWLCQLRHSPNDWLQGGDSWFVSGHGDPKARVDANSLMKIRVPDFDKIVVNGNFTVQLTSNTQRNGVAILGQYAYARQVMVDIHNRTLYLTQPKDTRLNLNRVIVRVSVRNLKCLTQQGCGNIYGRGVLSDGLWLTSYGQGRIMLMGNMNVRGINQYGSNTISIFGANTATLALRVIGNGNLNLCGQVGVQSIVHKGNGKIDIVGLSTNSLTIYASGAGVTQAEGVANLKAVSAFNFSRVYLSWVQSDNLIVNEDDHAQVGLAGTTTTLTLQTKGSSQFQGQYLFARSAYVKTFESSHANVNATQQLFLDSQQHSSIYYFSTVKELATLPQDQSIILQTHSEPSPCAIGCTMLQKRMKYKGE